MACSARSISVSTSPIPRIRPAIRSGWKSSKSSSFSPVDANAIGLPTTSLTDNAAPPRASPSTLVRYDPVELQRLVERLRRRDCVLARHGVDDEERVMRLDCRRNLADLLHHFGVDGQPAGGVDDQHVAPDPDGFSQALFGDGDGVGRLGEHRDVDLAGRGPAAARRQRGAAGRPRPGAGCGPAA